MQQKKVNKNSFKTKEGFLKNTIKYYSEDITRRCTSNDSCKYNPLDNLFKDSKSHSEGCAIGRFMSEDHAKKADGTGSVDSIISHDGRSKWIPKWMLKFGPQFLSDAQGLHDWDGNWGKNGLSETGKTVVKNMISKHNLKMTI